MTPAAWAGFYIGVGLFWAAFRGFCVRFSKGEDPNALECLVDLLLWPVAFAMLLALFVSRAGAWLARRPS